MMTQFPFRLERVVLIACPIWPVLEVVGGAIPNMLSQEPLRSCLHPPLPALAGCKTQHLSHLVAAMATKLIREMDWSHKWETAQQVGETERERERERGEGVCFSACPECYCQLLSGLFVTQLHSRWHQSSCWNTKQSRWVIGSGNHRMSLATG